MFTLILRLFSIQATLLSQNSYYMEDLILIRFITAFNDEKTIENWMKSTEKITLCETDLFKEIVNNVCSILKMISTERDINIRSFVKKTDITLENIGYPYYETFNVISSVKLILQFSESWDKDNLPLNILNEELDMIYTNLRQTTEQIWVDYNYTDYSLSYCDLININKDCKLENEKTTGNLFSRINFLKISTDFLDSVFPTVENIPVFVEAHKDGFRKSRKCIGNEILFDIEEGPAKFCQENILRFLKRKTIKQSSKTRIKLRKYMNIHFSCDSNAAKVIVMLFHYLSEIKGKDTR